MDPKNVIFLDIDGVLNSFRSALAFGQFPCQFDFREDGDHEAASKLFDPVAVALFKKLVVDTNSEVVLSSSWRRGTNLDIVAKYILPDGQKFLGITSTLDRETQLNEELLNFLYDEEEFFDVIGIPRGVEIYAWLKLNPIYKNYLIIDDNDDFASSQKPNFREIDPAVGFTVQDFVESKYILTGRLEPLSFFY